MQPVLTCTMCTQLSRFTFLPLVHFPFCILVPPLEEPSLRFLTCLASWLTFFQFQVIAFNSTARCVRLCILHLSLPEHTNKNILATLTSRTLLKLLPSHIYFYPANTYVSWISMQVEMKQVDGGTQYCGTVSQPQPLSASGQTALPSSWKSWCLMESMFASKEVSHKT